MPRAASGPGRRSAVRAGRLLRALSRYLLWPLLVLSPVSRGGSPSRRHRARAKLVAALLRPRSAGRPSRARGPRGGR